MKYSEPFVLAEEPFLETQAKSLAKKLGLLFIGNLQDLRRSLKISRGKESRQYFLIFSREKIYLRKGLSFNNKPIFCNFLKWSKKLNKTNLTKCMKGVSKDSLVIDATAGLGQDSLVLALFSKRVILLEKIPWIYTLLKDGLKNTKNLNSIVNRMHPICTDSKLYLSRNKRKADVIYLDPMFLKKGRSNAKQGIQALRELTEPEDCAGLLNISLKEAKDRVIVKRHRNSKYLDGLKPTFSLKGRVVRYDIYSLALN